MKTIKMSLAAVLAVTLSLASSSSFSMQKVESGWCISVINAAGVVVSKSCTSERTTNDGGS